MKLSSTAKKLLREIQKTYPLPWDANQWAEIVAVGERKIVTRQDLYDSHSRLPNSQVDEAINDLLGYQFIKKEYLYIEDDFESLTLDSGPPHRVKIASRVKTANGRRSGTTVYQITDRGMKELENFWSTRAAALVKKSSASAFEKIAPPLITFVLGFLVSAIFGINIRPWFQSPPKPEPSASPAPFDHQKLPTSPR